MNILAYVHLRNICPSTGAGRVARNITEQLIALNQDNIRILADAADHRRIVSNVGAPWDAYRYHLFSCDTSRQQTIWYLLDRPKVESFWPDADIVYCTAESYVPAGLARSIVTLHDAAFFEESALDQSFRVRKQRLKWKFLYRVLDRKVDLFHTVSQFSAERIAHFFPSLKSRLRVVPNGVTSRFFQPPTAEGDAVLDDWGIRNREFVLLPRGLNYRKNAELVLQAWPMLRQLNPDLLLVVTSICDPIYEKKARLLGPSVKIAGFVSDEALCSLYHQAAAVWFPSRYEGFGIPVLEAMACGTPVVGSYAASIPEVAADAAILISPIDAKVHVAALDDLLRNYRLRKLLSEKGRLHAANYTWGAAAAKLRAVLESLV